MKYLIFLVFGVWFGFGCASVALDRKVFFSGLSIAGDDSVRAGAFFKRLLEAPGRRGEAGWSKYISFEIVGVIPSSTLGSGGRQVTSFATGVLRYDYLDRVFNGLVARSYIDRGLSSPNVQGSDMYSRMDRLGGSSYGDGRPSVMETFREVRIDVAQRVLYLDGRVRVPLREQDGEFIGYWGNVFLRMKVEVGYCPEGVEPSVVILLK